MPYSTPDSIHFKVFATLILDGTLELSVFTAYINENGVTVQEGEDADDEAAPAPDSVAGKIPASSPGSPALAHLIAAQSQGRYAPKKVVAPLDGHGSTAVRVVTEVLSGDDGTEGNQYVALSTI